MVDRKQYYVTCKVMEEVDWPTEIIRDDFLLSEIKTTSSNFTATKSLDIITSTSNVSSCLKTPIINLKNNDSFKFSTKNDLLIKDSFNNSIISSSDYFGSECISPCSSIYLSSESTESTELNNHSYSQKCYQNVKKNLNFKLNNQLSLEKNKDVEMNTVNFINDNSIKLDNIEMLHSSFSSPHFVGIESNIINSNIPSPSFYSTTSQSNYYQYSPELIQDSYFTQINNQFDDNYYQYCDTNQTQARQQNLYKTCPSTDFEATRRSVKSEFHLKGNKFINQKRRKNNKDTTIDLYYHPTINTNNNDKVNDKISEIKKIDYPNFCEHSETAIESISKDFITDCYDNKNSNNKTKDPDIFPLNSSTSNLNHNISNRLKNRDSIIQEKLIPLPPQKTRSKMHDLAVKHKLITNQNMRSHGVIQLSVEEKRTLLQEGYRLPTRLPLTREEEETLKIVRRKIKNKLSAQESRRKRKEYIDTLEKKVHSFYSNNIQLRNRIKHLETLNYDLISQLEKFKQ